MLETYDAIISLGGNCGAASQLRMRGLRPYPLPFDWTYMTGPETIEWLCEGFADGFKDFCLKENLDTIEHEDIILLYGSFLQQDKLLPLHPFHYRRSSGSLLPQ